jgi:hypothetical protein
VARAPEPHDTIFATPAGVLRTARDEHPELGRHDVHPLALVLAGLVQLALEVAPSRVAKKGARRRLSISKLLMVDQAAINAPFDFRRCR